MVVLRTDALRTVVRAILQISERERPCAEAVLSRLRFACDDCALEVGVLLDVYIESAFVFFSS